MDKAPVHARKDLSKPPSDEELLARIVNDSLDRHVNEGVVSLAALVAEIKPQVPEPVPHHLLIQKLVMGVIGRGFALEIDRR